MTLWMMADCLMIYFALSTKGMITDVVEVWVRDPLVVAYWA